MIQFYEDSTNLVQKDAPPEMDSVSAARNGAETHQRVARLETRATLAASEGAKRKGLGARTCRAPMRFGSETYHLKNARSNKSRIALIKAMTATTISPIRETFANGSPSPTAPIIQIRSE